MFEKMNLIDINPAKISTIDFSDDLSLFVYGQNQSEFFLLER